MKKQFENQDIEKMISDRLSSFEANPSEQSKEQIFAAIKVPWYHQHRYALASLLLLFLTSSYLGWIYLNQENELPVARVESGLQEGLSPQSSNNAPEATNDKAQVVVPIDLNERDDYQKSASGQAEEFAYIDPAFDVKEPVNRQEQLRTLTPMHPVFVARPATIILPGLRNDHNITPEVSERKEILPEHKRQRRLNFNIDALTFVTFQKIVPNTTDNVVVRSITSPSMLSPERVGFRFSARADWRLSESFDVLAGFSAYSQRISNEIVISGNGSGSFKLAEERNAYEVSPMEETIQIDERTWSMGAQAGLRYYLPQSNRKFWVGAILDFQHVFDNQLTDSFYINKKQTYLNIETGWKTNLTDRLEFLFNPNLSYSMLQKEDHLAVFKIHPFSFGLNLGLRYQLW